MLSLHRLVVLPLALLSLVAGRQEIDKSRIVIEGEGAWYTYYNSSDYVWSLINETERLESIVEHYTNLTNYTEARQAQVIEDVLAVTNTSKTALEYARTFLETEEYFKTLFDALTLGFGGILLMVGRWGFLARSMGMATPKNVKLTMTMDFVAFSMAVLWWWITGFGIAFGEDDYPETGSNGVVGTSSLVSRFGSKFNNHNLYKYGQYLLHMGQCVWCASMSIGAVLERSTLVTVLVSTSVLAMLVFPSMAHVVWSPDGWLSSDRIDRLELGCGAIDPMGSVVVHMTAGVCALSATVILGPRNHRWKNEETSIKPVLLPKTQTSLAYEALGTILLFATACGVSMFSATDFVEDFAVSVRAMANTAIIASVSSLVSIALGYFFTGVISAQLACGGLLAGIAAAGSPARVIAFEAALVIGYIAGWAYYLGGMVCLKLRMDDVTHCIAIHFFAGGWGAFATGLFATPNLYEIAVSSQRYVPCHGLFYRGGVSLVMVQLLLCTWCICFVGSIFTLLFAILHLAGMSRFPVLEEILGVDAYRFGGSMCMVQAASDEATKRAALDALVVDSKMIEDTRKV